MVSFKGSIFIFGKFPGLGQNKMMVSQISLSDSFEVVSPLELSSLLLFENDQSGSNGDESTVTTEDEETAFSGHSPPSDAAEEWGLPKAFRSFYFVKHHPCDDYDTRAKIDESDEEIYRCNVARIEICNNLKAKRAETSALFAQIKCLKSECDRRNAIFCENTRESEPFKEALWNQLRSSEKETDDLICNMHYRIEHKSITMMEETRLLEEIKQLEGTREKIIANSTFKSKIHGSLGQKGGVIDRIKSMAINMKEVKKNREAVVTAKIKRLSEKLKRTKMEMESLNAELAGILDKRDKAFERIKMLRRQRDIRNATYFQSRSVMMRTRELATAGNVRDLEELANAEIEKFMSRWNTDKAFRDDYGERVSASLDKRQLSQDGRMKNLQEDPLIALEALGPLGIRAKGMARARDKRGIEDSSSCTSQDGNVAKEKTGEADCMASGVPRYQKPQMEEEIDEETSKEKKREKQLEKARQAMERKRKMQEKAAAKAAIRAQKEAEKRLKKLEKKAKEKAAASSTTNPDENREAIREASEAEKGDEASTKGKQRVLPKPRSFRCRHRRSGAEAPPKAIIKRRKANKFWVWAAFSAAFALLLLIFEFFSVLDVREHKGLLRVSY